MVHSQFTVRGDKGPGFAVAEGTLHALSTLPCGAMQRFYLLWNVAVGRRHLSVCASSPLHPSPWAPAPCSLTLYSMDTFLVSAST